MSFDMLVVLLKQKWKDYRLGKTPFDQRYYLLKGTVNFAIGQHY